MSEATPDHGERGERTRARLLQLAVRRFGERGYRETSLSAVARDAGVTPAAVYAYFPDKEGLFTAALDHDAQTWLEECLDTAGEGMAVWVGLLQRLHAHLGEHPLAHRVLAGNEPDMLPRIYALPALRRLRELLATSLREGQATGQVRPDIDPELIAEGIAGVVEATLLATVQTVATGAFADEGRRRGMLALLAAALLPPPDPAPPGGRPAG